MPGKGQTPISGADVPAQFRAAIAATGETPPDEIIADGKLHRYSPTGKTGDKAGWYILYPDRIPAGSFGNWRSGLSENWRADIGRSLTPEEEAEHRARIEAQRAAREAEAKEKRDKARRKATAIKNSAKPAPSDHPYLQRKGIKPHDLGVCTWIKRKEVAPGEWKEIRIDNALVASIQDTQGNLHTLQAIFPEKVDGRDKDFLPNGEKSGHFHPFGKFSDAEPLCVAEGIATAASIYEITGWHTVAALDAGNLDAVCRALREAHPAASMIVCADDDHMTEGNPGRSKAEAAAAAVGAAVAAPIFGADRPEKATDFNDLATSDREGEGAAAVLSIMQAARLAIPGAAPEEPTADTPPEVHTPAPPPAASTEPATKPADKAAKRTRAKAKAAPDPADTLQHGGEEFELLEGAEGRGVYRMKLEKGSDGKWSRAAHFVCAPLEITHQVRDARGDNWQRLATFHDHDGRRRRELVPDEMLEGDGAALAKLLRAKGLFIGSNKGGLLKMYVNAMRPPARARLTHRIGWHEDCTEPGRWSYVMGGDHDPIAAEGVELWLHAGQGAGYAQFKSAGTLADWRENVAALAVGADSDPS